MPIFYQCLIKSFSKIAAQLTSILKTTRSFNKLPLKTFKAYKNKIVKDKERKTNKIIVDLSKCKKLKNKNLKNLTFIPNIKSIGKPKFLIFDNKKVFNCLKQAFIKTLILQYFDPECFIQIEINKLGYIIKKMLGQLSTNGVILNKLKSLDKNLLKSNSG